jgi:hypothetical protein
MSYGCGDRIVGRTGASGAISLQLVRLETVHSDIELRPIAFHGGKGRSQGVNDRAQFTDQLLGVPGLGVFVDHSGRNRVGWVGDQRRYANGKVAVASMVVGSRYQMMWLGLKLCRKLTPSRSGQDLLLASSLFHQMATLYRPQYKLNSTLLANKLTPLSLLTECTRLDKPTHTGNLIT